MLKEHVMTRFFLASMFQLGLALGASGCLGGVGGGDTSAGDTSGGDTGGDTGGGGGGSTAGEPTELAGITAAHNALRAEVGVGPMSWNEDLEALAHTLFDGSNCVMEHSSQGQRSNVAGFSYVGENLYWSGGFTPSGADVSDAWGSEKADYDYESNGCSGVCGHYTQQVWESSTELGCAMIACGNERLVACEYGPGGNFGGERPY
jgi:pathogenesis-related protein 1